MTLSQENFCETSSSFCKMTLPLAENKLRVAGGAAGPDP